MSSEARSVRVVMEYGVGRDVIVPSQYRGLGYVPEKSLNFNDEISSGGATHGLGD